MMHSRALATLVVAVVVGLGAVGCGSDAPNGSTAAVQPSSGAILPGGGLSVAQAIASDADPPLAVSGWVVGSGKEARLCTDYSAGAAEPCIEPSLSLVGAGSQAEGTKVSLLGAVQGTTFVVASNAQG